MGVGTGLAFLNNITGIVVALGGNIGGQVRRCGRAVLLLRVYLSRVEGRLRNVVA